MDSRNLYDILGIDSDATPEQIRKAYKKKALQTHPDRLPPGANATDKSLSEEQFRLVNNAYEILNNPQNRKIYDVHGVWPPPEPREVPPRTNGGRGYRPFHHHHHRHHQSPFDHPFSDPFFTPFGREEPHFVFTDPFTLFDSIFGDIHRFGPPHMHHLHREPPMFFPPDPDRHFSEMNHFMENSFPIPRAHPHMLPFRMMHGAIPPLTRAYQSESVSYSGDNRRWMSESRMTSTVNGVTQSIWKRRDPDGNEHITRTYPDGREEYTVNGILQDSPGSHADRYLTAGRQQIFPEVQHRHRPSPIDYAHTPSPPSSSSSSSSSRGSPYVPNSGVNPMADPSNSNSKRKWWQSRW